LEHKRIRERFDVDALDPDDPFELDGDNIPHLAKHARRRRVGVRRPDLYPAAEDGPADWLMVARLPEGIVVVPLAPPRAEDPRKCRPIGIYEPSRKLAERYEEDSRQ
jgi:hypothetical protein